MPDREKVIKAIDICLGHGVCNDCPYCLSGKGYTTMNCRDYMMRDALALLKQEAVSAHWDDDTGHWIEGDRNGIDPHTRTTGEMIDTFRCSWCGFYQYWKTPFCPNCGARMERSVKQDDSD